MVVVGAYRCHARRYLLLLLLFLLILYFLFLSIG
jgi:hypothetical protein